MKDESVAPILLEYYKGIFDESEYELQKDKLRQEGILIGECDKSNIPMASADDIFNMVSLVIGNPAFQNLFNSVVIPGIKYDLLKLLIIWMWNSLKGKTLKKLYANGKLEEEDITFGLDIQLDKNRITMKLSGDVSDEDKNKCIDKAFEFLKDKHNNLSLNDRTSTTVARYDYEKEKWNEVDIYDEVKRIMEDKRSK